MTDETGTGLATVSQGQHVMRPQRFQITPIMPKNYAEVREFAEWIGEAGMAPASYMDKRSNSPDTGKIAIAVITGMELGLLPIQALNSLYVVNGMCQLWGDGALGIVFSSNLLEKFDESWTTVDGPDGKQQLGGAKCTVVRRGWEPITRQFTLAQARQAGLLSKAGPWQLYTQRMLQMRARAWALRDRFADVLRGMPIAEEFDHFPGMDTAPAAPAPPQPEPPAPYQIQQQPEAPEQSEPPAPETSSDMPDDLDDEIPGDLQGDPDAPLRFPVITHLGEIVAELPANEIVDRVLEMASDLDDEPSLKTLFKNNAPGVMNAVKADQDRYGQAWRNAIKMAREQAAKQQAAAEEPASAPTAATDPEPPKTAAPKAGAKDWPVRAIYAADNKVDWKRWVDAYAQKAIDLVESKDDWITMEARNVKLLRQLERLDATLYKRLMEDVRASVLDE